MSLIKDDGNSNDNDNDNDLIGWMMKSNRAVRAARTNSLMTHEFIDVVKVLWRSLQNDNVKFPDLRF